MVVPQELLLLVINPQKKKIKKAKPEAKVTTPSTASIKALKRLNLNKIAIFTPYPKKLNDEVIDFFKKENFQITSNAYFDIASDIDIGKVDANYLYDVLSKMDLKGADALFISCTALPALSIIDKLEKKLGKIVLSSNQTLIWDTLEKIGENNSINGFGKLFSNNQKCYLQKKNTKKDLKKFKNQCKKKVLNY